MRFRLDADLVLNVRITTLDLCGNVLGVYESHNTVINLGRRYLRDLLCCKRFPLPSNAPPAVSPVAPEPDEVFTNHRPKYVAVGVGGAFQSYSYPGGGSFMEVVTVPGLERPVPIAMDMSNPNGGGSGGFHQSGKFWQWLKQVEPLNPQDARTIPDDFSAVFRCILGPYDVSFVGAPGEYGMVFPLSEFLLMTSAADPYKAPCAYSGAKYRILKKNGEPWKWVNPQSGTEQDYFDCYGEGEEVVGAFAFNITIPQIKTPSNVILIEWEQRA